MHCYSKLTVSDVQVGVTSGQLLCAGLFSNDSVAHWLCSVTLAHCLYNNTAQVKYTDFSSILVQFNVKVDFS